MTARAVDAKQVRVNLWFFVAAGAMMGIIQIFNIHKSHPTFSCCNNRLTGTPYGCHLGNHHPVRLLDHCHHFIELVIAQNATFIYMPGSHRIAMRRTRNRFKQ